MAHHLRLIFAVCLVATAALGQNDGLTVRNHRAQTAKPMPQVRPTVVAPQVRQGGDTVLDAVELILPVVGETGTTAGYTDDYDEVCPYTGSTSPDVVYTFIPPGATSVDIDMLGSSYDTKIYIYDEALQLVACNDDFYPDYVSKLENVALSGGQRYYLVIDGYGGDAGDYLLNITEYEPCNLDYPAGAQDEMEPPLHDGYVDEHNSGCNSDTGQPFGTIWSSLFVGRSGWYFDAWGSEIRDTDWYQITMPYGGYLEIIGDAEQPCYMFELGPQDCSSVSVIQNVTIGPCSEAAMVIPGTPGSVVWFWVGPTVFEAPQGFIGHEFLYVLYLNNGGGITTEAHSWSAVKSLFE